MKWRELSLWRRILVIFAVLALAGTLFMVGDNLEKPPKKTGVKKTAIVADTVSTNQKQK